MVRQENLRVKVEGYGTLYTDRQGLFTSFTNSTIHEIGSEASILVVEGYIVAQLVNLELKCFSVELGQDLASDQEVVSIGSVQYLVSLISVRQGKTQQVFVGQKVIVDTRRDKVFGTVSRIYPEVENTVEVKIALLDLLPDNVCTQIRVDKVIIIGPLTNVTFMQRPVNIQENTAVRLFVVDNLNNSASIH